MIVEDKNVEITDNSNFQKVLLIFLCLQIFYLSINFIITFESFNQKSILKFLYEGPKTPATGSDVNNKTPEVHLISTNCEVFPSISTNF